MPKRKLRNSDLDVSAIGLGCMGMGFSYGPPKDKQEMLLIDLLGRIAVRKQATPAQIALAWLLSEEALDCPHPGHYETAPPGREPRGGLYRTHARRSA